VSEPGAPLLLAVETATAAPSLALWRGEALLGERAADPARATAEALLPALDALLADAGVALSAVAGFAVSIGPGSFTGLRIGVATVKGLAFGTDCPAVAISTLAAIAAHASGAAPVAAVLDARRGEVYAAGFAGGRAADWLPEGVHPIAALAERLPAGCRVVGEGVRCAPRRCAVRRSRSRHLPIPRPPRATSDRSARARGRAANGFPPASSCRATCAARRPR
jgi:tRNA threonylcarbamoyladenosine biosynthesis protein TsaB